MTHWAFFIAEMSHMYLNLHTYGLRVESCGFDTESVIKRSRQVARRLEKGVEGLLAKNKVDAVRGRARLTSASELVVDGGEQQPLSARHIVLATGARPRELPGIPVDGESIWNYKHAMTPKEIPASLMIIGAGAIGVEFASFYADVGADVTIIESLDRILPACDTEISALAEKSFSKRGITVLTGASVSNVKYVEDGIEMTVERERKSSTLVSDRVISAAGVTGNVDELGLETLGVEASHGCVAVGCFGETSVPGVWAIGDLAGPPCLAHKASHEAMIVIERIAGFANVTPLRREDIPACIYSRPQIASVGMTEEVSLERSHRVKVGRFPLAASGKAIAMGETEGLVKTLFDADSGELLGAHLIGSEVTELIHGFVLARGLETTEAEIMHSIFPHPTLSESMHESTLAAYGRAINI